MVWSSLKRLTPAWAHAIIVSPEFRGKNMVQQHQLVYRALGDRMKQEIHALSMKTMTPEQWAESNNQN